ncbi:MAG: hypothetical protein BWY68_00877 [bacterium ADurb.Bin400]|nr:MAG: hypothetical protein BWY68_00877 [bacterium ADurb.Bin400]
MSRWRCNAGFLGLLMITIAVSLSGPLALYCAYWLTKSVILSPQVAIVLRITSIPVVCLLTGIGFLLTEGTIKGIGIMFKPEPNPTSP